MLFFVKARVEVAKLADYGRELASGSIATHPLSTYCLEDDPAVGLNIWEAEDRGALERDFAPHRRYSEVLEILPVVSAQEAQRILMARAPRVT